MNSPPDPPPLTVHPVPPPVRLRSRTLRIFFWAVLLLVLVSSLGLNLLILLAYWGLSGLVSLPSSGVYEKLYSGSARSAYKVAVVRIEGVILEGLTRFAQKELERAAADAAIKAVVLRINSPGGTITASDDLYRRVQELRDGNPGKHTPPKPVVVSMGGLAASGAYYLAMPARELVAERTTLTGSIGVFAAFPNVAELAQKVGVGMIVIKAGQVKDSGSPFHAMTAHERELWQELVDHSYLRFLGVVEAGRPGLKGKLQEDLVIDAVRPIREDRALDKHVHYTRYRADGGLFTAEQALQYGLVDHIGDLDLAIRLAKQNAGLDEDAQVVTYERPTSLLGELLGVQAPATPTGLDPTRLLDAATPRLWYLTPQSEWAGFVSVMNQGER
jgi:protease-4